MGNSVLDMTKKLNKEFKSDSLAIVADVSPTYERCAVNDLGFDFPLYGGVPLGRVLEFSGKEGSGKTLAACTLMASYQRQFKDRTCVFVDVEHALDKKFVAKMTGLDLSRLVYVSPDAMSGEQVLEMIESFYECDDIGMIILDSIPALVTADDWDNDTSKDNGMRGTMAKPLNKHLRKVIPTINVKNCIYLLINQVRIKGKTHQGADILEEPCGSAPKFYSSTILRFGKRTYTLEDDVDKNDGEKTDGFRLKFGIIKSKTSDTQRGGGFLTFRYASGLDWMFDTLEVALKYEFVRRPTMQTYELVNLFTNEIYLDEETNEPLKFVGKQRLKDYFNTHVAFQKKYLDMLIKYISSEEQSYGSLLDERDLQSIHEEENSLPSELV